MTNIEYWQAEIDRLMELAKTSPNNNRFRACIRKAQALTQLIRKAKQASR